MASGAASIGPDLFAYEDYRTFLKDWYAWRKGLDRRFSFGVFARRAGVSRALFKVIADGLSNLTPPFVLKFARGLGLPAEEAAYFGLLVRGNQARDEVERAAAIAARNRWLWSRGRRFLSREELRTLASKWHHSLVLAMTRLSDFRTDPGWISRRSGGKMTPAEARESLDVLERLRLVRREGRRLAFTAWGNVESPAGERLKDRLGVWVYRRMAETYARGGRSAAFQGLTILSEEEAEALRRRLRESCRGTVPRRREGKHAGRVYAVVTEVFPLTAP